MAVPRGRPSRRGKMRGWRPPLRALIAPAVEIAALATLAILAAVMIALIAFETIYFAELREKMRHQIAHA